MTTTHDLTERYIEAATRALPADQRADHADELRASIADQIDARIEAGESAADAERAELNALGDPARLAAGYAERPMHLIGPAVFADWKRVLVALLWIVVPIAMIGGAIGPGIDRDLGGAIAGAIVTGISAALHACFWITLVFAIVDRRGGASTWTVDQLPMLEQKRAGVREAVVGFAVAAVFALAIVWDQLIGFAWIDGEALPILHPAIWPWSAIGVAVLLGVRALIETFGILGRRGPLLAACAILVTLVGAAAVVWLLVMGLAINPAFVSAVGIPADAAHVIAVLLIVLTLAVAVWDAIDAIRRARRLR